MKFIFADIKVSIVYKGERLNRDLKDYRDDFLNEDFSIEISENDVKYEKSTLDDNRTVGECKMRSCLRKIADRIYDFNALVLHSCTIDVNGIGVAFAAHSGTGKSTHMMLWQQLLGDKMTVVNGDKPIVRFFDDEPQTPYAYGTPWMGKERLGCNMRTPLKHICFITRSEQNSTVPITKAEALPRIMNQVYMPKDPAAMAATLQLINRLLDSVQLWKIRCNMDLDAAKTAYNEIFGAQNKN